MRSADGASEVLQADAVLVCLGTWTPFLLEPLGIRAPIYPVKGYSITVPVVRADRAPSVCLTDEGHKLAISRLGDRLRVAGTAELNGYDTTISERRCNALIERAKVLFPDAVDFAQVQRWAGLRPATPGNVPVIGRHALSQPVRQRRPRHAGLDVVRRLGPGDRRHRRRAQAAGGVSVPLVRPGFDTRRAPSHLSESSSHEQGQ